MRAHTPVVATVRAPPTNKVSLRIATKSAAAAINVRKGGHGTISPAHECSSARRPAPPKNIASKTQTLSLLDDSLLNLCTMSNNVPTKRGKRNHANHGPPSYIAMYSQGK